VRLLVRSEPEAFRLTVGMVFAVGLSVLIGYLFGPVTGIVLLAALTFVALLRDFAAMRSDRSPSVTPRAPGTGAQIARIALACS
jgi:hypothetical protein